MYGMVGVSTKKTSETTVQSFERKVYIAMETWDLGDVRTMRQNC